MSRGAVTTDGRCAYFTPFNPFGSNSVYQYEWRTGKWGELPACQYFDCGLIVIDKQLIAVGGDNSTKLLTLRGGRWVEEYPPMNVACSSPAVVSTADGEYLIVIGGQFSGAWTATVQIFQVQSRVWYLFTNLPEPIHIPSATICGENLHVIGIDAKGYSCSLQALPPSDDSTQLLSTLHLISWTPLPPLPVTDSTAATLCGQLVLIGGRRDDLPVRSIHQLVQGEWVEIGSMGTDRSWCLVATQSPDRILIVGGWTAKLREQDGVEECVVV